MQAKVRPAEKEPWSEPVIVGHEALRDVTGQKYPDKEIEKIPNEV
jgi:hypothetical protein